jgi:hypothetical protein
MRQVFDLRREALSRLCKAAARKAVKRAACRDHVVASKTVMRRRCDQIEACPRRARVMDVKREGGRVRQALDRERDRHAAPAARDYQTRPRWLERRA